MKNKKIIFIFSTLVLIIVVFSLNYFDKKNKKQQKYKKEQKKLGVIRKEELAEKEKRFIISYLTKLELKPDCKEIYENIKICQAENKDNFNILVGSLFYTGDDLLENGKSVYFKIKDNEKYLIQRDTNITGFQLFDSQKKIRAWIDFYYSDEDYSFYKNKNIDVSEDYEENPYYYRIGNIDFYRSQKWDKNIYAKIRIQVFSKGSVKKWGENISEILNFIDKNILIEERRK